MPVRSPEEFAHARKIRKEWKDFNTLLMPESALALQHLHLFTALCLKPGADLNQQDIAAPGYDNDAVFSLAAQLMAMWWNVKDRRGMHHNDWTQLGRFAVACTAVAMTDLPDDDPRRMVFQNIVGHTPQEFRTIYDGQQ